MPFARGSDDRVMQRFDAGEFPYGVFSLRDSDVPAQIGVAVGDQILALSSILGDPVFAASTLNPFMAKGRDFWRLTRDRVRAEAVSGRGERVSMSNATMHLPFDVADYVDLNSSLQHATNAGLIFRPGADPVRLNWRLMPVGYHGRAGTIVASGTRIGRPRGQFTSGGGVDAAVVAEPTQCLDVEAEVGFVVGRQTTMGDCITTSDFFDHVFGVVLVLDWSARDIQALESVPLGPFLGKSFATSISTWVLPLDALEYSRVAGPLQTPPPVDYLRSEGADGFDLRLDLRLNTTLVSSPRFDSMYWTPPQQLAHLTSNGARLRVGDLFASGTVSDETQFGSLLELSWNGTREIVLDDGTTRGYLDDGDEVVLDAVAVGRDGSRLQLGQVRGVVSPTSA